MPDYKFLQRVFLGDGNDALITSSGSSAILGIVDGYLGETKISGLAEGITATGGTITYADGYVYHTFTSSGDFTITRNADIPEYQDISVFLVGGGGTGGAQGAGSTEGSGGGGGRVVTLTGANADDLGLSTPYSVTVGLGAGASDVSGSASSVFGHTAPGGGSGRTGDTGDGYPGGSGGGGARPNGTSPTAGGTQISGSSDSPVTGTIALNLGSDGGVGINNALADPDIKYAGGGGGASSRPIPDYASGTAYATTAWNAANEFISYSGGGLGRDSTPFYEAPAGPGRGGNGNAATGGRTNGTDGIVVIKYFNPTYQA